VLDIPAYHQLVVRLGPGSLAGRFIFRRKLSLLPKNEGAAAELKKRTLTNLYNARPQWLADAHRDLDAAVAAAYGWPADISEEDALGKLLELNLARAGTAAAELEVAEGDD